MWNPLPQETTRQFYQCVMGGGGHDIHFGIYKEPTDGVKESSEYTTQWWGGLYNLNSVDS